MTVVPEIDMPGHMLAAIAVYPELGNTGRQFEVYTRWGISEHVLNLEETTVQFCASVLGELTEIFPGPYIHMGGDECPTVEWEESPRARQLSGSLGFTEAEPASELVQPAYGGCPFGRRSGDGRLAGRSWKLVPRRAPS